MRFRGFGADGSGGEEPGWKAAAIGRRTFPFRHPLFPLIPVDASLFPKLAALPLGVMAAQ